MEKKKYSVYMNKDQIGCHRPYSLAYVFINESECEYEKKLIHPVERLGTVRYIGPSCCFGEPPSEEFMNNLEYIGEVDSIKEINYPRY